jgi:hypothetical protein
MLSSIGFVNIVRPNTHRLPKVRIHFYYPHTPKFLGYVAKDARGNTRKIV